MTSQELRRNRRLERPRERVLQEAWDLMAEKGLADLSLSELGRRLETSAGHLSYYFGSKNGLLLELLRWSEDDLIAQLNVVLDSDDPALERLRGLCELFFPRAVGDPRWLLWVELWPRVMHEPALQEAHFALDEAWREAMVRLLEELVGGDVEQLSRRMLALMDGLSVALLTGEPGVTQADAWEHVQALLPSR
ncbi:TetR/AcrR family transcriptional regulator [Nocardioides speluncae]|uniref:TetR/AcrR family transcriptional regulator n=1 Tax=Nocardioides speluncae TaxID=2670337 RepID=UPI000D68A7D8|nr:TetR/AcrR family transcriptional regulator [Nocardioides speluncae]